MGRAPRPSSEARGGPGCPAGFHVGVDLDEDVVEDDGCEDGGEWAALGEAFLHADGVPGTVGCSDFGGAGFGVEELDEGDEVGEGGVDNLAQAVRYTCV